MKVYLIIMYLIIISPSHIFADAATSNPAKVKECNFPDNMNCFQNRDIADAEEINANFQALVDRVDNIYSVNGNIGIGTLNPSKKFEVSGDTFLNGKTQTNYLILNKTNSTGEGGEVILKGSDGFKDIAIDNFNGHCRVFGFGEGNVFEIHNGSLSVHKNATIGKNLYVNGTTQINYLILNKTNSTGEGGELILKGSDGFQDIVIDNLYGHCRVFGFGEGKVFEIKGSLSVHKNAGIGGNLQVNGELTGNAFTRFKKDMVKVVEETTKQTRSNDYNKLTLEIKELRNENVMLKKRIEALEKKMDAFFAVSK